MLRVNQTSSFASKLDGFLETLTFFKTPETQVETSTRPAAALNISESSRKARVRRRRRVTGNLAGVGGTIRTGWF